MSFSVAGLHGSQTRRRASDRQISQLNEILEETRTTIKESHTGARSVSDRLSRDLAAARKASQDLSALIERAETILDRAIELQSRPVHPMQVPVPEMIVDPARSVEPQFEPDSKQHTLEPEPEPVEDPTEDEAEGDALAERDFDLADARGEPQLGFLPSIADTAATQDLALDAPDVKGKTVADPQDPGGEAGNLLQVERMAL